MKCDRVQENLSAYLSDETSASEDKAITDHLEGCPECREVYVDLRQTWKAMDAWNQEAPTTFAVNRFRKNLRQVIAQEEAAPEPAFEKALRQWSLWSRGWRALSIPAFAVAITAAFFWAIGLDVTSSLENLKSGPFRSPSYVLSTANAANSEIEVPVEEVTETAAESDTLYQQAHPAKGGFTVVNYESPLKTASSEDRYETSIDGDYY